MICNSCNNDSINDAACSHCGITMQTNDTEIPAGKYTYVPLGTRCSAAYVVRDQLKKRQFSLPFDWIGMPGIYPMIKFFGVELKDVDDFMYEYFQKVRIDTQRHPDEMWFVHDVVGITGDNGEQVMRQVKEKYIRRFKRFIELLKSGKPLVFITVMGSASIDDALHFEELKTTIRAAAIGTCFFITVNLVKTYFEKPDHVNFYIPIDESADFADKFHKLETDTAQRLLTHRATRNYFI